MDITVSRLNARMALRVPSELPLGLVFIVGQVEGIGPYPQSPDEISLRLTDGDHSLPCRLPQQVADEMQLAGNERVRAGGHLVFDTLEARYYLLARDIEVLPPLAPDDEIPPQRRASASGQEQPDEGRLAAADLPPWVQHLAPPEVQSELGFAPTGGEMGAESEEIAYALPAALVDYLSQAIDSDQEIELTPTLVHELLQQYQDRGAAPGGLAAEPDFADRFVAGDVSAPAGAAGEEKSVYPEFPIFADDDSVPVPEPPAGPVEPASAQESGAQKRQQPSAQRQALLLIGGVLALFIVILLIFVVIALAAGYTPFLFP